MTSYLNEVSKALGETVNQTRDQLRQMQPAPLGREPDSGHKQAALWKKLRELDREHFNSFLDTAAQKVGQAMYEQAAKQQQPQGGAAPKGAQPQGKSDKGGDDVIDAEYEVKE